MDISNQSIYFQMNTGYRILPVYQNDSVPKEIRARLALDLYAQTIVDAVNNFANNQGFHLESPLFVKRLVNLVQIDLPVSLNDRILSLDESGRKTFFSNAESIISSDDMTQPLMSINAHHL